ncbi:putative repeat protein (TIGR01451 family) [Spirosoma lacussanchae]|uniref:hypothetical protein n=1 Tax=Spirosoma lacussanchae TaxID=1884249 RepID=UPI001FE336A2|nr:hypothetical protein [Spirosoma lacussanchae]
MLYPFFRLQTTIAFLLCFVIARAQSPLPVDPRDTLARLAEDERLRTLDPALGRVPSERLDEARRLLNRQQLSGGISTQAAIPGITWQERGPSNAAGRTRALLFDPNDPARKKVWAGSPAGGLWYTTDITDSNAGWTPVSDNWENTIVTALAADPSNPQIMYAGTGDGYGGINGGGIWKTTNGGTTWARLSSTIPGGNYPSIGQSFTYIQRLVVTASGQVFAATRYGLVRSTDGGASWAFVLAPNQGIGAGSNTGNYYNDLVTDLELASDGILYAAFNPSRVFRSTTTAGTSWTEITPPNTSGERTELALAPTTGGSSQVLYAVSRAYNSLNYGQDIKWFKKSSNGGISWTDLVIPTSSGGSHFTKGNGSAGLSLAVHPTDPNTVYAGGYDWFRSTDGGSTWNDPLAYRFASQQGLWFQPGSAGAAFADDIGIHWSANWGDTTTANPTLLHLYNNHRISDIGFIALRDIPGSSYMLAGITGLGYFEVNAQGIAARNHFLPLSSPGSVFIDDDEPAKQIVQWYSNFYIYIGSSVTLLTSLNNSLIPNPSDYDSQANILYTANYANSQYSIRRVTGVGTTPVSTTLPLTGFTNSVSALKLGRNRDALFVGNYSGKLVKVTNLDQATPTVTNIDNGALPPNAVISCIDVGADDNELLVTVSNYGVQSVWYTQDGGATWTGKDQTNFGLPDVPVRTVLFNPQNRKQVLLGTDAGIWSTSDITLTNPGWTYSGTGMGPFRINQLRYRASDGRVVAATQGRGVWQTDALAVPYTPLTITLTGVSNTTLCAGNVVNISYTTTGPGLPTGATVEVWVSDASGSFADQRKIGSGTSSPISVTLPSGSNALPFGTGYRLQLMAPVAEATSNSSTSLAIGDLAGAVATDRRGTLRSYSSSGEVCTGSRATLSLFSRKGNYSPTGAERYQWLLNGSPLTGATSQTVSAQQAGTYSATVWQAGCTVQSNSYQLSTSTNPSVSLNALVQDQPLCISQPQSLSSSYIGETAAYQWTRNGVDIAGATASTLTVSETGQYSFRITDGTCSPIVSNRNLNFGQSLYARLNSYPAGDSILCTGAASIYLVGDGLSSNQNTAGLYTIQWYRDNVAISGANRYDYYASQPGTYWFQLMQGTCTTRSNAFVIRQGTPVKPQINSIIDKTACPGDSRQLYANPYVGGGSYQWQKDGVDMPGATSSGYTAQTSGTYTLQVTRGSCQVVSDPVSLTFTNAIQPVAFYFEEGQEACSYRYFYASQPNTLSGTTFQWFKDGVAMPGQNNSFVYTNQAGVYSVSVTNGACSGLSKGLLVRFGSLSKPTVQLIPASGQVCADNAVLLKKAGQNNGTLVWKRNGTAIYTGNQYYATQSGLYSVVQIEGACSAESDPVEVRIGEPTAATLTGGALISSGQTAQLPITFSGPAPWSVTLTNGQSASAIYQNPYLMPVSPTSTTTYSLSALTNACSTGAVSGVATVTVGTGSADVALQMQVSNRVPKVDEIVSYTLILTNAGPQESAGVQVRSVLPAGLVFVDSPSPGISAANGIVTAEVGTVPVGSSRSFLFRAKTTQPGVFATSAQITATQTPDPDSQPNSGTGDGQDDAVTTDLRTTDASGPLVASANPNQQPLPRVTTSQPATDPTKADLSLSSQINTLTPQPGEVVSLSLTVSNRGGASANSIVIQTQLPANWVVTNSNGWAANGQQLRGYVNKLAAGQSFTLVLAVRVAGSATLQAQIQEVTEQDPDSTPGNGYANGEDDTASLTLRVR